MAILKRVIRDSQIPYSPKKPKILKIRGVTKCLPDKHDENNCDCIGCTSAEKRQVQVSKLPVPLFPWLYKP